jgi:hypothetical protein
MVSSLYRSGLSLGSEGVCRKRTYAYRVWGFEFWGNHSQGRRNREGTLSSRSNCTSSNEAATPYHPGTAAGSIRWTRAVVTISTLPCPIGRLTSTISSSISAPRAISFGQRKNTPVELMSRVTSVTGKSSARDTTLRNRKGSLSEARGYSRCSWFTPTACVGTRPKPRGGAGASSGLMRRAGTRTGSAAIFSKEGARLALLASFSPDRMRVTRFVALISPPEMPLHCRHYRSNCAF